MSNIDQGGRILKNTSVNLPFPIWALAREQKLNVSRILTIALIRELRRRGIKFVGEVPE